ncbi:MAG: alkaline phosphatase D family protein [Hyphomicrobiaceae bacterium]
MISLSVVRTRIETAVALFLVAGLLAAVQAAEPLSPSPPWRILDPATVLERIAFGSCLSQRRPQPIWKSAIAERPQLFLMLGDNVYGDVAGADMKELKEAYSIQAAHPDLAAARAAFPFLATWDDHDYGRNDAGAEFPYKSAAARLFHKFWQTTLEPRADGGLYYSRIYGPEGRRVQIVMLDMRSFRSPLKPKSPDFPHWGKYEPDDAADKTMLGTKQWAWLETELKRSAELRLLVSGIQVLSDGHGFERWGNFPRERGRLIELIARTGAKGVIVLSGDRHMGAFYRRAVAGSYPLVELTSSSLNWSFGETKDTPTPELASAPYSRENFGSIGIDWTGRRVELELKGVDGRRAAVMTIAFSDLGLDK